MYSTEDSLLKRRKWMALACRGRGDARHDDDDDDTDDDGGDGAPRL
jgi:hypothetical protein